MWRHARRVPDFRNVRLRPYVERPVMAPLGGVRLCLASRTVALARA